MKTPAVHLKSRVLRVLGTSVTQIELLKNAAEQDLGVTLEFITTDGTEAQRRGALTPKSFDVYDQWFHNIDLVWPTGSIQGININRITRWDEINDLPKTGRLSKSHSLALGGDPSERLFVQSDGSLSKMSSERVSMLPTVSNADSFGIIGDKPEHLTSWGCLLDPDRAGQVMLQTDAAIGSLELLLALEARNQMHVGDLGNLELEEIDQLTDFLGDYCKAGHFLRCWADEAEAIEGFQSGIHVCGSLWWSGFIRLRALGVPVHMATPEEGYRGWFGGMSLSAFAQDYVLDMAYEYLNWWLDGYAGAVMSRNGSYMSNPDAVRKVLSKQEWDFWYEGLPAETSISDAYGNTIFAPGESRGGGSYQQRMSRVVVWNTIMDEHNYLVRKWEHALSRQTHQKSRRLR